MRLDCRKERANAALGLRRPKDRKSKVSAWLEHATDFLEDHRRAREVMHHKIAHHRNKRAGLEGELLRIGFLERDTRILAASDSHHLCGKVHARDDRPSLGERMGNVTWTRANLQHMAAATDVRSLQEQGDRFARHAGKGVEITLCTTAPGFMFELGDDLRIHRFAHGCPPSLLPPVTTRCSAAEHYVERRRRDGIRVRLPQPLEPRPKLVIVDRHLAVEHSVRPESLPTAAARSAKRRVWSTPLRLTSRTRSPSLYASIRQPVDLLLVHPAVAVEGVADERPGHRRVLRHYSASTA
jgi:hypothetical protein